MSALIELAERVEAFNAKIRDLMGDDTGLSAQGTAVSIGLLVALNLDAFEQVASALRARATEGSDHAQP